MPYTSNHMKTSPTSLPQAPRRVPVQLWQWPHDGSPEWFRGWFRRRSEVEHIKMQWSVFKSCCLNMNSMLFTHKYRFWWPHNIQIEIPPKGAPEPAVNIELVLHLSLAKNEALVFRWIFGQATHDALQICHASLPIDHIHDGTGVVASSRSHCHPTRFKDDIVHRW